ncbi:MAG: O-antigen ligase family protein [Chloroflexota bacterium]
MMAFRTFAGRFYTGSCGLLWLAALFLLPITSFPPLSQRLGGVVVAPLSAFLLLLLAAIWLFPYLVRGGKLPRESGALLAFLAVAVVSWALAQFTDIPSFRRFSPLKEGLQVFATLALGMVSFYVPAAWLMGSERRLRTALRAISLGGVAIVIWCLVQAWYVYFLDSEFTLRMYEFQWLFSTRQGNPLIAERVTGFAYEPSWLAHQLNLVYLPLWLAATLGGHSVFPRLWRISLENVLLAMGVFSLFASHSRVGWLSFLAVLVLLAVALSWKLSQFLIQRLFPRASSKAFQALLSSLLLLLLLAGYAWGTWKVVQFAARYERRLERILSRDVFQAQNVYEFFNNLEFAERVIYWAAGMRTFSHHWLIGVGPGNFGFYFPQDMPRFGWWLTEITDLMHRFSFLPNTKNFWVRLLAETGLVGFAVFVGWLVSLLQSAWFTWRSRQPLARMVASMGLFSLTAFLIEGFSIDSFALPYLWVAAGLLVAARTVVTAEQWTTSKTNA